jgi:hypothetical protein
MIEKGLNTQAVDLLLEIPSGYWPPPTVFSVQHQRGLRESFPGSRSSNYDDRPAREKVAHVPSNGARLRRRKRGKDR